jgi:hypothetical protein
MADSDANREGVAINKLLVGTSCNRTGAVIAYREPVVFSIGATGGATYVTENFVDEKVTRRGTYKWQLSDLEDTKLRTVEDCAVLELICKKDQKCIRSDSPSVRIVAASHRENSYNIERAR